MWCLKSSFCYSFKIFDKHISVNWNVFMCNIFFLMSLEHQLGLKDISYWNVLSPSCVCWMLGLLSYWILYNVCGYFLSALAVWRCLHSLLLDMIDLPWYNNMSYIEAPLCCLDRLCHALICYRFNVIQFVAHSLKLSVVCVCLQPLHSPSSDSPNSSEAFY